jgi:hypothetical protein
MTLTDERRAHVKRRLDAVVSLAAAKRALNAAWFAIHDATTAINEAEQATRREALQNVERAA